MRHPEVDALEPLLQALQAPESWTGAADAGVVLAERDRDGLWGAAHGPLRVSQRAVPLDHRLTRLGPSPLRQPRRFVVEAVELADQGQTWDAVEEGFSLGLFQDADLDESIRAPLVEKLQSGLELAGNAADAGEAMAASTNYEEIRLDAPVAAAPEGGPVSEPDSGTLFARTTAPRVISHPPLEDYPLDEADFYRVDMQPVIVELPRFLAIDDALNPDEAHDESAVATGVSYARARECCLEAGFRRHVVRRYEVAQDHSLFG